MRHGREMGMQWYGCQDDAAVLLLRRCRSKEQGQTGGLDDAQNRRTQVVLWWDCAMAASKVTEVLAVALRKAWDGIRLSLFSQALLHLVQAFSRSLRKGESCPGAQAGWQKKSPASHYFIRYANCFKSNHPAHHRWICNFQNSFSRMYVHVKGSVVATNMCTQINSLTHFRIQLFTVKACDQEGELQRLLLIQPRVTEGRVVQTQIFLG